MDTVVLPSLNQDYGFWGTMGEQAAAAWPLAFSAVTHATGSESYAVRAFLDSRHGRHFADEVCNQMFSGLPLEEAIGRAAVVWTSWRISRRTSRDTGIPAGLPYLLGFVQSEGIALDNV